MTWKPLDIQRNGVGYFINSESTEGVVYQVGYFGEVWKCTCRAYLKEKLPCKHIGAVIEHLKEKEGAVEEEEAGVSHHPSPSNQSSLARWTKKVHGRDFILYEGLVAIAHERGLVELGAEFISVTMELALAKAWATFQDGRSFKDAADATPNNVAFELKPHFARMALTRAKARVLRDALNIGMCSVEEVEG